MSKRHLTPYYIVAYFKECGKIDGSSCGPNRSAWGCPVYRQLQKMEGDTGILPGEIYDDELCGVLKGRQAALMIAGCPPIEVLLDNQLPVQALRMDRTRSPIEAVETFSALYSIYK